MVSDPGSISFIDIRGRSDPVSSDSVCELCCAANAVSLPEPFLDDGRGCQVNSDEFQVVKPLSVSPGTLHR